MTPNPPTAGELLPCPFCGSDDVHLSNTHTPSFSVECEACGASASGRPFNYRGKKEDAKFHYDPESPAGSPFNAQRLTQMPVAYQKAAASAVEAWNRRATRPASAEGGAHPDDVAVDRFAAAMKAKLSTKRAEGYFGWDDPIDCEANFLRERLLAHVGKGDPVDVGNFAMMLFNRGESTALPTAGGAGADIDDEFSAAPGGPEWQRGFNAGREQGRREIPSTPPPPPAVAANSEYEVACEVLSRLVDGLSQQFPNFPECDSDSVEADVLAGISGYIQDAIDAAPAVAQPQPVEGEIVEREIVWSVDQETFNSDSLDEAIDLLDGSDELEVGRTVWFGEAKRPDPSGYIDADDIIEMIGERAYDDGGEHAEYYPEVSDNAKAELEAFLSAWLTKHCQPNFWKVENVKEYGITEAEIAAWRKA